MIPRSGDVLQVTRAASVQFVKPIYFRVSRVLDWPTYNGWAWLEGYELNTTGEAVDRRTIFVQLDGLHQVRAAPTAVSARSWGRVSGTRSRVPARVRVG